MAAAGTLFTRTYGEYALMLLRIFPRHFSVDCASGIALLSLALGACGAGDSPPAGKESDAHVGAPTPEMSGASTTAKDVPEASDTRDPRALAAQSTLTPSGGIDFYSADALRRVADELARGPTTTRTVNAHAAYHYVQARRIANGVPEVHDGWTDVTIVQQGHATLLSGGRVEGSRLASPGEHRGGTIVGGVSRRIAPGDFFVIPAGVPHQYQIMPGDSVRYLTIKVLQPGAKG